MSKIEIKRYKNYICRIKNRPTHNGNKQKPEAKLIDGKTYVLTAMWGMGDDDPYPAEYAMGDAVGYDMLAKDSNYVIAWIASGDVEVLRAI